ncbi:uncharacterized protein LTR77_003529 [Saxophila tyrrhenica]|uniref:Septin-type G domain-containing protein n=1 Tax=Saxophila tyrrhenica TaxID=1690608 RepID=A0AAV9PF89_9PEZI|nr:hypothetical protein LTR77_003529 [Saxophila tyrrhenica]
MSAPQDSPQHRTVRGKRVATGQPPYTNPGHSGPTTFFLKSEKDIEAGAQQQRGRKMSRASASTQDENTSPTPSGSMSGDSSFGVQSLEDTINPPPYHDSRSLSRTDSNISDASFDPSADPTPLSSRKRKAGNPVHPRIAAAGQRIISSDHLSSPTQAPRNGSPVSLRSIDSPVHSRLRRGSAASSLNLSQPITPLKMSPQPASAMPSTPRSGSPKSFRLSDGEVSEADSQAVQSSCGDEEEGDSEVVGAGAMPQLVMPSIAMPSRRPFTERGRLMGRLKVMAIGQRGVGKTSLIQSMCRACEDVVHVDSMATGPYGMPESLCDESACTGTRKIEEIGASTRPYPSWWTDFETRRMLLKRKSMGEGVLERNITFVDTPGFHEGHHVKQVLEHFKSSLSRMTTMGKMGDSELIGMLSGEGGVQTDAVIYVFEPQVDAKEAADAENSELDLLRYLCKWTNVIPVIGRADEVDAATIEERKKQLLAMFEQLDDKPFLNELLSTFSKEHPAEPFAISSALADDSETIDASVLMSSSYLQPLIPSELDVFVSALFEPNNTARLRHFSATKFLLWRQENLGSLFQNHLLLASPEIPDETSKVLVPHGDSSYFRSASPTTDSDNAAGRGPSPYARALANASPSEPFRQLRLAKWAQDLQRSLDNERRRVQQRFYPNSSGSSADSDEKHSPTLPLTTTSSQPRGAKGRLGGPVAIIDPRDPLGLLAFGQVFRRRGYVVMRVAAGAGVVGAVCWWVLRNWTDVQEWLGFGGQGEVWSVSAVPAPSAGVEGWREWAGLR